MKLQEKADLIDLPVLKSQNIIYFLLKDEEVVYVGMSHNGAIRPYMHVKEKEFDSIKVLELKNDSFQECIEADYILKYDPKYNKTLTGCHTLNSFKKTYKKRLQDIGCPRTNKYLKKVMLEDNIEIINFRGVEYFYNVYAEVLISSLQYRSEK